MKMPGNQLPIGPMISLWTWVKQKTDVAKYKLWKL